MEESSSIRRYVDTVDTSVMEEEKSVEGRGETGSRTPASIRARPAACVQRPPEGDVGPEPFQPRFTDSWILGFSDSWIHGSTDSRIHGFTDPRIHSFTVSRIHGFTVSRFPGFMVAFIHGFMGKLAFLNRSCTADSSRIAA